MRLSQQIFDIYFFFHNGKAKYQNCWAPLVTIVHPIASSANIVRSIGEKQTSEEKRTVIDGPNLESQSAVMFASRKMWVTRKYVACCSHVRMSSMIVPIFQGTMDLPVKA